VWWSTVSTQIASRAARSRAHQFTVTARAFGDDMQAEGAAVVISTARAECSSGAGLA
jgi:hypothetical protein